MNGAKPRNKVNQVQWELVLLALPALLVKTQSALVTPNI